VSSTQVLHTEWSSASCSRSSVIILIIRYGCCSIFFLFVFASCVNQLAFWSSSVPLASSTVLVLELYFLACDVCVQAIVYTNNDLRVNKDESHLAGTVHKWIDTMEKKKKEGESWWFLKTRREGYDVLWWCAMEDWLVIQRPEMTTYSMSDNYQQCMMRLQMFTILYHDKTLVFLEIEAVTIYL